MKKELLWFFGALAVVAVLSLIVGMTLWGVLPAKVFAMGSCIITGALVGAYRERDDSLVVSKYFMFACTSLAIMIAWQIMDLVTKHGIIILYGFGLVLPAFLLFFVLGIGSCLSVYWRDRPEEVTIRRAVATCAAYILPAMIITPLAIYL